MTEPATSSPAQFTVRGLFVLTAMCALVAAAARLNVFLAVELAIVELGVAYWLIGGNVRSRIAAITAGLALLMILAWCMQSYKIHEPSRSSVCRSNLRGIAGALNAYRALHGTYPPAYIADRSGKRLHSWRVLILPYLEQESTYDQYRFDEPWDGPHNRLLAAHMPSIFHCPSDTSAATDTSYLAVLGPDTPWSGKPANGSTVTGTSPAAVTPAVLLVESSNSGINWMEPRDLDLVTMSFEINAPQKPGLASSHPGGVTIVRSNKGTDTLRIDTPVEEVRRILSDSEAVTTNTAR